MATFVTIQSVRDYLAVTGTSGQWTDGLIGSNINAASSFLQRRTHRLFEVQSNIKRFSTHGRAAVTIPDLRSAVSVTLDGTVLTADESYYLIPDRNNTGVNIGIEFPSARDVRGLNTFDINYSPLLRQGSAFPNDLEIDGHWGHLPLPDELLQATKALAAFWTLRPDALLSGVRQTPEGNIFDLSRLPVEVAEFIANWNVEPDAVVSV